MRTLIKKTVKKQGTAAIGHFFFQSRRVSFNFETSPKAINEILLGVDQGPYLFPFDDNNLILVHVAFFNQDLIL
jgi:hypothetical protein